MQHNKENEYLRLRRRQVCIRVKIGPVNSKSCESWESCTFAPCCAIVFGISHQNLPAYPRRLVISGVQALGLRMTDRRRGELASNLVHVPPCNGVDKGGGEVKCMYE